MKTRYKTWASWCLTVLFMTMTQTVVAQSVKDSVALPLPVTTAADSVHPVDKEDFDAQYARPLDAEAAVGKVKVSKPKKDWSTWHPNPQRALWLALVLPGAGQIYNHKYWKLPLIYGGFVGCAYALRWNNMMYHDYSQAYIDIMDNDPNTQSYNQFLHLGTKITPENMTRWQDIFRKRKDRFRRWRDMSIFVMIGIYALSVVDAYVDASLSEFDISPDLTLHIAPTMIKNNDITHPFKANAIGLQCSLTF